MVTCKKCGTIIHVQRGNILEHNCEYPNCQLTPAQRKEISEQSDVRVQH